MKLKITITMDNAAFEPENGFEAARILRDLAREIEGRGHVLPGFQSNLREINGNRVGEAKVTR